MPKRNYSEFSLADFLEDDFFVNWVISPDPESDDFWETFQHNHPEKKAAIQQAISFVTAYRKQDSFTNASRKKAVWDEIAKSVVKDDTRRKPTSSFAFRLGSMSQYMKIAATVTLIMVVSAVFWLLSDNRTTVTTAYNEVTTIKLPDHSIVTLNGNSTLKYNEVWDTESPREVWVEGEAYFNVRHLNKDSLRVQPHHRFVVHSSKIDIEVLGTSFNVKARHGQTDITLITGKVKVQPTDQNLMAAENIIMLPGDHVEYNDQKLISKKKVLKPQQATAWVKHELIFTDAHLKDILKVLVDDYGYTLQVKEPVLLDLKIEGEITVTTIQELLSTISATLDLQITETPNKHIVITRK